jgi:N-acetylneuraminate synthase
MDGDELSELLRNSKEVHLALGGEKGPSFEEEVTMAFAFASVVATRDIKEGEYLTLENLWVKRPSGGDFTAADLDSLIGKTALKDIPKNTQVTREQVEF